MNAPVIAKSLPTIRGFLGPILSERVPMGNSLNIRTIKYPETARPTKRTGAVNSVLTKGAKTGKINPPENMTSEPLIIIKM